MTKIKVCGLKRKEDIEYANILLPDYIGFVFAKSKRQVTKAQASALKKLLDNKIKAVGVFVNDELENIVSIANAGIIDLIQLHGDEDEEFCKKLKTLTSIPVIKAIRIKDKEDLSKLTGLICDYILFDTYSPDAYGGTGKTFDYKILDPSKITKPFLIAGGLNKTNVAHIAQMVQPYGVDVSGGVETDGLKDFAKMQDFIKMVRKEETSK